MDFNPEISGAPALGTTVALCQADCGVENGWLIQRLAQ